MRKSIKALVLAGVPFLFSATADAALLNFQLTGSYTANFQLDSSPTVSAYCPNANPNCYSCPAGDTFFQLTDVSGTFPGSYQNRYADIYFYAADTNGGLEIDDAYDANGNFLGTGDGTPLAVADGDQLFTGPVTAPVFRTGTFLLTEDQGDGAYTLVISTAAVPEPATWMLSIVGFGAIGAAMRGRRNTSVTFSRA